jgi:hypothetical protein
MDEQQVRILVAEFETSWQQLFMIDNRRGAYFLCYSVVFAILLTSAILALTLLPPPSLSSALAMSVAFATHALFGRALIGVYESERAANVRYRKKINLIREILLKDSNNADIEFYLQQKEIGIKSFTGSGNEIDPLGGTLAVMYQFIRVQQVAAVLVALLAWVAFGLSRSAA